MSYLARTLCSSRASTAQIFALRSTTASFHNTSITHAMSEADSDDPSRSSKIETHKQDSVSRAKSGQGEWKPELASQSEQSVKGDKTDMSMEEMQKMGQGKAEQAGQPMFRSALAADKESMSREAKARLPGIKDEVSEKTKKPAKV